MGLKKLIPILLVISPLMSSCDFVGHLEHRARVINNYEVRALQLAKQNRELKTQISNLRFEIQELKAKNNFLTIKLDERSPKRNIASIPTVKLKDDFVKDDIYNWKPEQIISMAEESFEKGEYEKSAQYFKTFLSKYPNDPRVNDAFLFQTGVASFESGKHHQWTMDSMTRLVNEFPTSKYYRGAKLWMALTKLKQGDKKSFFNTVEEFRIKYRNTTEWKILSAHYEKLVHKYKE